MKFKYSAFIENTPEMREWLESLGKHTSFPLRGDFIYTSDDIYLCVYENEVVNENELFIDCRSNPDLFKAVTAIREDSDKWQYFTNGVKFILFDNNDFNEFYIKMNYYRKATLSELQEHFKTKQP